LRFGTGMGAVLVFLSGGGRGVPGGGNGLPRPIGSDVSGLLSEPDKPSSFRVSPFLAASAFRPHLFAEAAALATDVSMTRLDGLFASGVLRDLAEDEVDVESRLRAVPSKTVDALSCTGAPFALKW